MAVETKKYIVTYASGATGYGWEKEFDRISEFEDFVRSAERTMLVRVWDNVIEKFIYWKDLFKEPSIDMLASYDRDLRTTSRKRKAI